MNLLTLLLRLPLLPLRGFLRLGELIDEEVQRELRDPARLRHDLERSSRLWSPGKSPKRKRREQKKRSSPDSLSWSRARRRSQSYEG